AACALADVRRSGLAVQAHDLERPARNARRPIRASGIAAHQTAAGVSASAGARIAGGERRRASLKMSAAIPAGSTPQNADFHVNPASPPRTISLHYRHSLSIEGCHE